MKESSPEFARDVENRGFSKRRETTSLAPATSNNNPASRGIFVCSSWYAGAKCLRTLRQDFQGGVMELVQ